MTRQEKQEKSIHRIILFCSAILIVFFAIYTFIVGKTNFQKEVAIEIKGIITDKFRAEENNPKAYRIKINDSAVLDIPFLLIEELSIGDTILKEKGKDYYSYHTRNKIIKVLVPAPNIFGYPKDKRDPGKIENR